MQNSQRVRDAKPRTAPMARRRDGDIAPYRHYSRKTRPRWLTAAPVPLGGMRHRASIVGRHQWRPPPPRRTLPRPRTYRAVPATPVPSPVPTPPDLRLLSVKTPQ